MIRWEGWGGGGGEEEHSSFTTNNKSIFHGLYCLQRKGNIYLHVELSHHFGPQFLDSWSSFFFHLYLFGNGRCMRWDLFSQPRTGVFHVC